MTKDRRRWALLAAAVFFCVGTAPSTGSRKVIARIDLSGPFRLPPGATFTAAQGPPVINAAIDDPYDRGATKEPGHIHLCVRSNTKSGCSPDLDGSLRDGSGPNDYSDIHYLEIADIVHPRGADEPPLLHLQLASLHSTDGDQARAAEFLAYRTNENRFAVVFQQLLGRNHNEEVRYVASGPLKGAVISVEPTDSVPFAYWVTVNQLTYDYRYKQILKYRSVTHYGDGNPLAVIDSEMPNILRRLGLWRAGQPLPMPKSGCAKPRLVKSELWCS